MEASILSLAASPAKPMPFVTIRDLALAYGRRMDLLAGLMAPRGEFHSEVSELAAALKGISLVLDLLGATPNAYVNREALDALQSRVTRAGAILAADWAEDLASRGEEAHGKRREAS